MVEKKVNNIKIRFISELKARNSANFLEFGLNPNFSTKINENINKSVHSFDSLMFNIRYSGKLLKLGKKYDMKSVWNKFWAKMKQDIMASSISKLFLTTNCEKFFCISRAMLRVFTFVVSLEFKSEIKKYHQHLNIRPDEFDQFKLIFIQNLQDYQVDVKDLEIVLSAIKQCP